MKHGRHLCLLLVRLAAIRFLRGCYCGMQGIARQRQAIVNGLRESVRLPFNAHFALTSGYIVICTSLWTVSSMYSIRDS